MILWRPSDSTGSCVEIDSGIGEAALSDGPESKQYEELTCLYPALRSFYFDFEVNHKSSTMYYWMRENPWFPLLAVALYASFIFFGKKYFQNRKAWNWRNTMMLWNLSLSVFSAIGFLRTFPMLVHIWSHYTFQENFCNNAEQHYGNGSTGLWVQLFVLSKIPELIDTFFIIIHKKNLIFLHWYHHVSVLLYCWHSYMTRAPHGLIFCVMNYAVHCVMYGYYFLMAARIKPKAFKAVYITIAQISQMVVGVAVTAVGCYLLWVKQVKTCFLSNDNNVAALIMYGSYLFLFLEFFLQRYFNKSLTAVHLPAPKDKKM